MEFKARPHLELIQDVDERTGVLAQLETAAGMKGTEFQNFYMPLVEGLAAYVLDCPLERDAYAEPTGALRFGLMASIFALRQTTRKMFTGSHGSEQRRLLDKQYRFASFAASVASIPAIIHSKIQVTAGDESIVWSPYHAYPQLGAWLSHIGAHSYQVAWRTAPIDVSRSNAIAFTAEIFKRGFWMFFDAEVVREMYDSIAPAEQTGREGPLWQTVKEGQRLAREYEKKAASGPYIPVEMPSGVTPESVAAAIDPPQVAAPGNSPNSDPTPQQGTVSTTPRTDPATSPATDHSAQAATNDTHATENPVHARARVLLKTLPAYMTEMFAAVRMKPDYEALKASWVVVEDGIEVPLHSFATLGRATTLWVDDLKTHKLFVRPRTGGGKAVGVVLTPECGALLMGEVDAIV